MLNASTIIEVLVSMILLSIAVGIGSMSFNTVLKGNTVPLKVKATLALQEIAFITQKEKRYFDELIQREPLVIQKTVTLYKDNKNIFLLELEAYKAMNTENNNMVKPIIPAYKQLIYVE